MANNIKVVQPADIHKEETYTPTAGIVTGKQIGRAHV